MFIPLHDANSLKHIKLQYVTIGLIAANVDRLHLDRARRARISPTRRCSASATSRRRLRHRGTAARADRSSRTTLTYLTYAFLHADIFHLGGNMLFLWVFGDNVEDALGHFRFLDLLPALRDRRRACPRAASRRTSQAPLIGASGAIAGVVAAYLVLHPRVKVWILAFARIPLRIPAYIALVAVDPVPVRDVRHRRRGPGFLGLPCRRHHRRRRAGAHPAQPRRAAARPRDRDAARRQWSSSRAPCARSRPSRRRAGAGSSDFEPI